MSNHNPSFPQVPLGYKFHHVGYATNSLSKERDFFACLGYEQEDEIFVDQVQGVVGCFMVGHGPRVELLENLAGSDTLTPWLNANIKIYHFAYLVDDINEAQAWAKSQGARVTVPPVPAVAFSGRRISFVIFRNGLMIEFIENPERELCL